MSVGEVEACLAREFPQVAASGDFTVLETGPMTAKLRLNCGEHHLRPGATVSGPTMFALADIGIWLAVLSASMVINQIRTLAAHLWENDGKVMTITGQYLDSVNVPPPALLPELWAPVGLRYHALHHLLPSVPYHALPAAHRRLVAELPRDSSYHGGNHPTLRGVIARLSTIAGTARA